MASTQKATGTRIFLFGGEIVHEPPETGGASTINDIHRFKADMALLSPFGIEVEGAATNFFEHTAEIARAMVRSSAAVVLIADHSKVGVTSRVRFCDIRSVNARHRPQGASVAGAGSSVEGDRKNHRANA